MSINPQSVRRSIFSRLSTPIWTLVFVSFLFFVSLYTSSFGLASTLWQAGCLSVSEGNSINDTIEPAGDEDCFIFQGVAEDNVTVFVDNNTSTGSHRMNATVFNPDGSIWDTVTDSSPFGNGDLQIGRQVLTATGTFKIIIDGVGDTTGNYSLGYSNSNLRNDITPIVEGQAVAGNIGFVGDEDAYSFQAEAGDLVSVFVDNNTSTGSHRMNLTVYNPDGSVLKAVDDNSPFGNGDLQVDRQVLTATGIYKIIVDGSGDTTGNYAAGYSNLNNDTSVIVEGQAVTSTVGFVGDEDAYTFQGEAGNLVAIFVDNNTSTGSHRMHLTVFNPDGSVWGSDVDDSPFGNGDLQVGRQALTATGTYTVVVDGFGDTTGNYTLGYSNLKKDTTPIVEGQGATSTISFVGDEDAYTFQGLAGDLVTVFVDNNTSTGGHRMHLTVLNPDGSVWATDTDDSPFGNGDLQIGRQALPTTGTYTVIVDGSGDTTGNYTLGYSSLSNDLSSIAYGQAIDNTIDFPGDEDIFTFHGNVGTEITLFVDNNTSAGSHRMQLTVLNPDGSIWGSDTDDSPFGNGDLQIGRQALTTSGTYTIIVDGSGDTTGLYKLLLECVIQCPEIVAWPNKGGNTGFVSVRIVGRDFVPDSQVKLVRSGQSDIVGNPTSVHRDGTSIATTFDLTGKAIGIWNVVILDPTGASRTIPGAFTVEEGRTPHVWLDIIGRDQIRAGREQTYYVLYGNRGNVNASGVPIWIAGIPKNATWSFDFKITSPRQITGGEPIDWNSVPIHIEADHEIIVPLIIGLIPPNSTGVLKFSLNIPDQQQIQLRAWANPPLFDSNGNVLIASSLLRKASPLECEILDPFREKGIAQSSSVTNSDDCLKKITELAAEAIFNALAKTFLPGDKACLDLVRDGWADLHANAVEAGFEQEIVVFSWSQFLISGVDNLAKCIGSAIPIVDLVSTALEYLDKFADLWELSDDCKENAKKIVEKVKDIVSRLAYDPNDKIGSKGGGNDHYLSSDEPLRYLILFENVVTATASAQEVTIIDQLDPTKVDLSSVNLGPITFSKRELLPPLQSSEFVTDVDLRPIQILIVHVDVKIDRTSGQLVWRFISIDPATGQPPEDPLAGFLPPNVNPPEGEGSVFFTVMAKPGLPTGTEIANQAHIVFDANPAIVTPAWLNVLDNSKPSSEVLQAVMSTNSTDFEIQWSGEDTGSGIDAYSIFVSDNCGPYSPWLTNVLSTTATFVGSPGHSYQFTSQAKDKAGNLEEMSSSPDIAISIPNLLYLPVVAR